MLKEFIAHIQESTQPIIQRVGDSTFVIKGIGGTEELHPAIYHPDTLPLHSLEALVKMVQTVNANWKMSFFAGMGCHFLAVSMRWVCSLDYPLLVGLKPVKS